MALVGNPCLSSMGQRLPSRRRIDQRWDRSRGIIFSSNQRNALRDFRWSCGDGITFAETPGSTRNYPTRRVFAKEQREEDLVDSPHKISMHNVGQNDKLREMLENERKGHEDMKNQKAQEILEIKEAEKQLEVRIRDLEIQLSSKNTALATKNTELAKELAGKNEELAKKLARKDAELAQELQRKTAELSNLLTRKANEWETAKADLRSKLSTAQQDAKSAAEQKVVDLLNAARQKEQDAASLKQAAVDVSNANRNRYSAKMEELSQEKADELQDHKNKLESAVANRFLAEVRSIRQAGLHREEFQRSDYATYREQWDQVNKSTNALGGLINTTAIAFFLGAFFLGEKTGLDFKGEQIHPWFPHQYPLLNSRLQEFVISNHRDTEQAGRSTKDLRLDLSSALTDVDASGHVSRSLTRYFQFQNNSSNYVTSSFVNATLYEAPLREILTDFDNQIARIMRQIELVRGQSEEHSLQQRIERVRSQRSATIRLSSVLVRFKEVEALKAMLQDSPLEKEIFAATQESRDLIYEANKIWSQFTDAHPILSGKSQLSEQGQKQDRRAFVQNRRQTQEAATEFETLIRQRHLLQMHLGHVEDNNGQFDANIRDKISRSEHSLYAALGGITATRGIRNTAFVRASRPLLSSAPVVTAPNHTPRNARLRALESEIRELKEELDLTDPASHRAREEVPKKIEEVKHQVYEIELAILKELKVQALRQSPQNAARIQQLDSQTRALQALLAAKNDARTPSPEVDISESKAVRGKRTSLGRGRRAVVARASSVKLGEKASKQNKSDRAGNEKDVGESGLNIKPTAVQKAPHDFWPVPWRSVHSVGVNASETLERPHTASRSSAIDPFPVALVPSQVPLVYSLQSIAHASCCDQHMRSDDSMQSSRSSSNQSNPSRIVNNISDNTVQVQASKIMSSDSKSSQSPYEPPEPEVSLSQESLVSLERTAEGTQESQSVDMSASDAQLTYQISAEDYRSAALASRNTNAAFWSHQLYKGAGGNAPTVHYCTTFKQAENNAKEFLSESVLGFDIEWETYAKLGKSSIKQCVSLIQIASESRIALFHVAVFKGETPDLLMPPSLRTILESSKYAKVGVNVAGDATRLDQCLGVRMTGLFELSHLYKVVMFSEHNPGQVDRRPFKLADQVQNILLLPMKKDETRTSHWSKRLDKLQTEYAASDAYAGFRLYHALEAKRKQMEPTPPRPAFHEEHKPLQLGDGNFVVARPKVSKRKADALDDSGKAVEEDDDECEEYFDAVESLNTYQLDTSQGSSLSAGVPAPTFNVAYPSLPVQETALDTENVEQERVVHATTSTTHNETTAHAMTTSTSNETRRTPATNPGKRQPPPESQELNRADVWVTTWRASLPTEYKLKCGTNELRAWHLWHEQGFDCKQVAAFLRVPPLSINTVASYLMQAVKEENLAFDVERMKEPLGIIPASVHGRYQKILDRVGLY